MRDGSLLIGDCNIHGSWDPQTYDPNASRPLEEYIEESGRIILNDGTPTLYTPSGPSSVDIAACPARYAMAVEPSDQQRKRFGRARWSLKKADWVQFADEVEEKLQESSSEPVTIDEDNRRFVRALLAGAKQAIPRGNLRGKIWRTDVVATAVEERKQAADAHARNPSPESFSVFSQVRANTDAIIASAKQDCWRDRASTVKADSKGWNLLAVIDGKREPKASIVADCRKSDPALADDIVKRYVAKNRNYVKSEDLQWKKEYLKAIRAARVKLSTSPEFSMRELMSTLSAMPTRTATGPDSVEFAFLRNLSPNAIQHLLNLANRSWREGVVPAAWREVLLIGTKAS